MAISQTVKVTLDGVEPYEVTFDGRDVRKWEEMTGKSALREPMSLSMLAYVAWSAARRTGKTDLEWEAFNEVCSDVTGVKANPTRQPRKAASRG